MLLEDRNVCARVAHRPAWDRIVRSKLRKIKPCHYNLRQFPVCALKNILEQVKKQSRKMYRYGSGKQIAHAKMAIIIRHPIYIVLHNHPYI